MPLTIRKIINCLLDGYWHRREDLLGCINSRREGGPSAEDLRNNLYKVRLHLRPLGYVIDYRTGENKEGRKVIEWSLARPRTMDDTPSSADAD